MKTVPAFLASIAAVVLLSLGVADPALAAGKCLSLKGEGETVGVAPGVFVGSADFVLGGVSYPDVPAATILTSAPAPAGSSGVLFTSSIHTFSDGLHFATDDRVRIVPTDSPGVYRLISNMTIVGGGSGRAQVVGIADFATSPPTVSWSLHGSFCPA